MKKAVHDPGKIRVRQKGARGGGGRRKFSTGEKGRAYPPNCDKTRKRRGNP